MYNRYNASTGEYMRLPDTDDRPRPAIRPEPPEPLKQPETEHREPEAVHIPHGNNAGAPARRPGRGETAGLERLLGGLGGSVSRSLASLDTEDLLLLAVVYLMYRSSGDRQLLIVLAALLFS